MAGKLISLDVCRNKDIACKRKKRVTRKEGMMLVE